MMIVEFNGPGY